MGEIFGELKPKFELLTKEYQKRLEKFKSQEKICSNCKLKIQMLVEMKNGFESVLKNGKNRKEEANLNILFGNEVPNEYKKIEKKVQKIQKDIEILNKNLMKNVS